MDVKRSEDKTETAEDVLIEIASQLEPDGGMPGQDEKQRVTRSIAALYAFISHGHTPGTGAFRSHVARLLEFLKNSDNLHATEKRIVERVFAAASTGHAPTGEWLTIAQRKVVSWEDVASER